ncbi:uncharacterized protein LOC142317270 isoform X2 [Lycorma delicatula]|uniref:uncharacterized protein LOC142317270 isoform X2 n=1 Tax=Lycorma delicatula TaxID=130591 RepID=UPI003F519FC1
MMRAKIFILNLMIFNPINALLKLNPSEYTECTKDTTLSCSCLSMDDCAIEETQPTMYLKESFFGLKIFNLKTNDFEPHSFKIHFFEDTSKNHNDIIPVLRELLKKIPKKIMIKGGIIHTKKKSLISGINVKNLSTYNKNSITPPNSVSKINPLTIAPQCFPQREPYNTIPSRVYITMDCTYVFARYQCDGDIYQDYFFVSDKYNLENTVEKNDMSCFLQSNTPNKTDNFNYTHKMTGKEEIFSGLHFELYFSYICKLFVGVPRYDSSLSDVRSIPLYQSYKFTVSGYHLKNQQNNHITGLRYLVTQKPVNNKNLRI